MNLAYKKILGKFTKVLGFGKTPPPMLGKIPKWYRFFLRAYLTPVILQKLVNNIASLNLANYPERLIFGLILQNFTLVLLLTYATNSKSASSAISVANKAQARESWPYATSKKSWTCKWWTLMLNSMHPFLHIFEFQASQGHMWLRTNILPITLIRMEPSIKTA